MNDEIYVDPTIEVKRYKVTPAKNKSIPDIVPFGRIEEPGYYYLNKREARRAMNYGHIVEEAEELKFLTEEEMKYLFLAGYGRVGIAGVVGGVM